MPHVIPTDEVGPTSESALSVREMKITDSTDRGTESNRRIGCKSFWDSPRRSNRFACSSVEKSCFKKKGLNQLR